MRIPYLDFGLERRWRWTVEDRRAKASPADPAGIIESWEHLDICTLERLRDCLNRKIEERAATGQSRTKGGRHADICELAPDK